MTTNFLQTALIKARSKKQKKNGFTLIELMVVVAIVGVLSAVGLPALTKAQDKAKDTAAEATLVNAAKECSLSLITTGGNTDYNQSGNYDDVLGICKSGSPLGIASTSSAASGGGFEIPMSGSIPGQPIAADATRLGVIEAITQ